MVCEPVILQDRIAARVSRWCGWGFLNATKQVHNQIHRVVTKTGLAMGFVPRDDQIVRRCNRQRLMTDEVSLCCAWLIALRRGHGPMRLRKDQLVILDQLQ